jgi:hypothetical protein
MTPKLTNSSDNPLHLVVGGKDHVDAIPGANDMFRGAARRLPVMASD